MINYKDLLSESIDTDTIKGLEDILAPIVQRGGGKVPDLDPEKGKLVGTMLEDILIRIGLHAKDETDEKRSLAVWLKKLRDEVQANQDFREAENTDVSQKEKTINSAIELVFEDPTGGMKDAFGELFGKTDLTEYSKARGKFRKMLGNSLSSASRRVTEEVMENLLKSIDVGVKYSAAKDPYSEGFGGHSNPWHFIPALKKAVQEEIKSAIPSGISKEDYEKLLQTKEGPIKALTERLDKIEKEKDTKIASLEQDNKLLEERLKKVENVVRLLIQAIRIIKN